MASTTSNAAKKQPTGFRMSSFVREKHDNVIYSAAWSTDVFHCDGEQDTAIVNDKHHDDSDGNENSNESSRMQVDTSSNKAPRQRQQVRYLATCGGNHIALYEVEIPSHDQKKSTKDPLIWRQAYVDRDQKESFFACAFGGRSLGRPFGYHGVMMKDDDDDAIILGDAVDLAQQRHHETLLRDMADTRKLDGPQLVCVAGSRGVIKVIDTVQQMLVMTLSGHGNEIYDLKFSPRDEWLLLSASKDESARLWNVKTGTCVAIFAGHEGHRDSVLTVGWHPHGNRFASGSMDNTVKLWNLAKGTAAHAALQDSNAFQCRKWNVDVTTAPTADTFKTAYEQMPYFSSNKIHHDYVDSVEFVGDLILSKSVHNNIVLWKPNLTRPTIRGKPSHIKPPNDVIALCEFTTRECDVWFIRFGTSVDGTMLAIGNQQGEVNVWNIDDNPTKKSFALLTHPQCTSTVRMVAFSPDTSCFVAACDDASIWKWDATYS